MSTGAETQLSSADKQTVDLLPLMVNKPLHSWLSLLVAFVPLLLLCWMVEAQATNEWSKPQIIYETRDAIDTPYLASDPFGMIHLLWRETEDDTVSPRTGVELLFYAENIDGNWGQGIDIIADTGATAPSATVDAAGTLHLVWVGPNSTLMHAYAPVGVADSALNWSQPAAVATANLHAHITADRSGNVHLVYPGRLSAGVYYSGYDSVRGSWSSPVNVAGTAANNISAEYARMAVGPDGTLHVVWSEFMLPEGWPPTGVYYAQSKDGGLNWSTPIELAGDDYDQITVAAASDGRVHVAWNGMVGVGGRYHRWSDDGLTWSPTVAVVPPGRGGTEGPPQLEIDNDGIVHMLTTFDGCAWHVSWQAGRWSDPLCISGSDAMASNWIEQPALTLSNGNQLHAVFWDDRSRLWHTTMMTGAPPTFETLPVLESVAAATVVASPTPLPTATATPRPVYAFADAPPTTANAVPAISRSLLIAALAVSGLLALVLLQRLSRTR